MGVVSCWWVFPQAHKKLKYEVAVHAQIVPMFALDSLGNPIFDLKKEDLELWVNEKPYPIYLLTLHRFEYQEESQEDQSSSPSRVQTVPRVTPALRELSPPSKPKRVIFLIIDLQHSDFRSLDRAKKITAQFIPKDKKIKTFNIDVKCKRSNVTLHAVKFSKQKKTYARMKSLQKKVFAMDVATGGYWSRTAAEVRKANYSTIRAGKTRNRKEKYWRIQVDIPKEIRNKVAEIFLVRFNEGYQDAEIEIYKRVIRRWQTLTLKTHGDKKLVYFVIVEPKSAYSIYNQVE